MRITPLILALLLCAQWTFGQLKQRQGQILLSDSLHQFEIKNDSLLEISEFAHWLKYSIASDTLTLQSKSTFKNEIYQLNFKIIANSSDSLFLIDLDKKNKIDTLKFISASKRKVSITSFNFLRIDEYGTWGTKRLIITGNKVVQFANEGFFMPNEPAIGLKTFQLNQKEYNRILDTLSSGLLFMLSNCKRGATGFDPTFIDISYDINGKLVVIKDIRLSSFHWKLYKYLIETFSNK